MLFTGWELWVRMTIKLFTKSSTKLVSFSFETCYKIKYLLTSLLMRHPVLGTLDHHWKTLVVEGPQNRMSPEETSRIISNNYIIDIFINQLNCIVPYFVILLCLIISNAIWFYSYGIIVKGSEGIVLGRGEYIIIIWVKYLVLTL
jgi:hypothetical protein